MKKVVFIAYSLNNPKSADGIQTSRLLAELSKYYDVKIYARDFNNTKHYDIKNTKYITSPNLYFLEIIIYKLFRSLYPIFGIDKLVWSIKAYSKIRKNQNVDFIITTHEPYSLFFLIKKMKKKFKCSLITLLFDPLVDNIMYPSGKISLKIRQSYEFKILKQSDILFLYTNLLYKNFIVRYPSFVNKIKLLNFCSENELYDSDYRNKKITLIHAGNLAGNRDLKFIVRALLTLKQKYGVKLSETLQIISYGGFRRKDHLLIKNNDIEDLIFLKGFIEKDKLYNEEMKADVLIVIDSLVNFNVFFPSKLTEYFMFNKMIFAITPNESATREWLEGTGHMCFSEDDIILFIESIEKLIHNRHYFDYKFDKSLFNNFTPVNVTKKLISEISKSGL